MIYVGFSASDSWLSRLIRWMTGSEVSHAFVGFDWLDTEWVLEADRVGVRVIPFDQFAAENHIVDMIPVADSLDAIRPALLKLGRRYDYGGLFGSVIVLVGRWLRLKWHNPLQNGRALFCSELVVEDVLKPMGWPGAAELSAGDTNPADLRRFLRRN
jgi:hypothetical protein